MSIFVFVVICLCVCISMVIMSVTVPVCTYLTHALSLKELNVQWLINNLCIRQHKILDQLLKNLLFLCLCVIYRAKYLWYCNGKVVEIKRLRGKLLYTLTKHLFSIHRGLFLEFVSISAKVPMILVLVGDIRWCMCVLTTSCHSQHWGFPKIGLSHFLCPKKSHGPAVVPRASQWAFGAHDATHIQFKGIACLDINVYN